MTANPRFYQLTNIVFDLTNVKFHIAKLLSSIFSICSHLDMEFPRNNNNNITQV